MRNGLCPRCASAEVRVRRNGVYQGDTCVYVAGVPREGVLEPRDVDVYVCTACGYLERYLVDPAVLARVAATWPRVRVDGPAA